MLRLMLIILFFPFYIVFLCFRLFISIVRISWHIALFLAIAVLILVALIII